MGLKATLNGEFKVKLLFKTFLILLKFIKAYSGSL